MGSLLAVQFERWQPTSHHLGKGAIKHGKRLSDARLHVYEWIGLKTAADSVTKGLVMKSFARLGSVCSVVGDSCKKTGRPRKYGTQAERARAYRERKKGK